MSTQTTDVLIIGTGIAGLTSAIKLGEAGKEILIITREKKPETTNTYWAQGGIIFPGKTEAEKELLLGDIQRASSFTSNVEAARLMCDRSAEILDELLLKKTHTEFAHDKSGELLFTKEAAHSSERIIYNGDMTGKTIEISVET